MPSRKPKTVVNVTFQGDEWDYDERVSLGDRRFRRHTRPRVDPARR